VSKLLFQFIIHVSRHWLKAVRSCVSVLVNQLTSITTELIRHTSTIIDTGRETRLDCINGKILVGISQDGVVLDGIIEVVSSTNITDNWTGVLRTRDE